MLILMLCPTEATCQRLVPSVVLLRERSGPLRIFGAGEPAQRLGMLVFTEGPGVVLITHVAPHNSGPPVPEALKPLLASLGTRHSMID